MTVCIVKYNKSALTDWENDRLLGAFTTEKLAVDRCERYAREGELATSDIHKKAPGGYYEITWAYTPAVIMGHVRYRFHNEPPIEDVGYLRIYPCTLDE
jgi:hypothetical protein